MDQFPGPNRYMDGPPEWNAPDEPEDPEPDPVQVAKDAAECTAYEEACACGYSRLYLAIRAKRSIAADVAAMIHCATKSDGGWTHPHWVY